MLRVELLMSLVAGFAGGLVGTLWSSLVSTSLLAGARARNPQTWHADSAGALLTGALLYGSCGALLGLLFWLGWGLIALVQQPWPLVGALFGLLCWAGVALPLLGMLRLRLREPRRVAAVLGIEWLVTCLAVGLLCAMTWQRVV